MAIKDHYGRENEEISPFEDAPELQAGTAGGFIATTVTALAMMPVDSQLFSDAIAGMYGMENALVVGLFAHLVHGTLFGLVFAFVLSDPGLVTITNSLIKTTFAGMIYGMVLALVGTGIIMPIWLNAVGVLTAPAIPYVTIPLLGMHLLYGFALGVLFPFLETLTSGR